MWIYHIGHICCSDNKVGGFRFALLVYWLINSWISFSFVCVGVWMCGVCKPFLTISRTESNILRHINLVFSPSGKCIWFHCISTCVSCAYVYQFNYVLLLAIESTRFNFHFFFVRRLLCKESINMRYQCVSVSIYANLSYKIYFISDNTLQNVSHRQIPLLI